VQADPALQVPLLPVPQQGCPKPPQAAHTLPPAETVHETPLSQPPPAPGQQAWPAPPHALQMPPPASASVKQPKPLWQLLPAQQGVPLAPQLSQVATLFRPPGLLQPRPALHVSLAQQGWVEPPQGRQT
jgi:hypothetical protein